MQKARLIRDRERSDDQGTPGYLEAPGFFCAVLELPWRDNARNRSCIPAGLYVCSERWSPKYGWCYQVTQVPERDYILFHPGNLAGDRELGYLTHTYGCILLGRYHGVLEHQKAVLASRPAVREFQEYMASEAFELEIIEQ